MLTKIIFFMVAMFVAVMNTTMSAIAMLVLGYAFEMPIATTIVTAATVGTAAFGVTIAFASLAANLFLNNRPDLADDPAPTAPPPHPQT